MTRDLEDELRAALRRRAAAIGEDDVGRLLARRRASSRGMSRTVRVVLGGGLTGTAVAVAAVVLIGGAVPAYAGWKASPVRPSRAEQAAASESCAPELAELPGVSPDATWTPVVSEQRGPYTLTVYSDGSTRPTCLSGPSLVVVTSEGGGVTINGGSSSDPGGTSSTSNYPSEPMTQLSENHVGSGPGAFTFVQGNLGSQLSDVTFVLSDGKHVTATSGAGLLVAWWPGSADAVDAEVSTPGGVVSQPLSQPPAGGVACSHGSSAGRHFEKLGGMATCHLARRLSREHS